MSGSILERLEARLSAKPAVISIETLFSDLEEAHAEITALTAKIAAMSTAQDQTPPVQPPDGSVVRSGITPHIAPDIVAHVHTLLTDAEERMSVHAHGTVSSFIARAKKLLEGG